MTILKKSTCVVLLGAVVLLSACNDNSAGSKTTHSDTVPAHTDTTNMSHANPTSTEPVNNSQY